MPTCFLLVLVIVLRFFTCILLAKCPERRVVRMIGFRCIYRGVCGEFKSFHPHQKKVGRLLPTCFLLVLVIVLRFFTCILLAKCPECRAGVVRECRGIMRGVCGEFKSERNAFYLRQTKVFQQGKGMSDFNESGIMERKALLA